MNSDRDIFRKFCINHNIPIISYNTEVFLKDYITKHKPNSIIEIWSAVGFSTTLLWKSMLSYNNNWEIISREISYPHYRQALINSKSYKNINIYLWNFCLYELDNILKKWYYDMIFIDGRKSETLTYLKKLLPYIHNNSHIIIDDVIKFKWKMKDCYDFLDKNNISYKLHKLDDDDWILIIQESQSLIKALSFL